ncbi:ribonuclease III [Silanimonas sp.]|uniref:ribonuclease III n=1 Tax=Silanimonas sp. TaxID=1929290 RepID=UPI001BC0F4E2|nr:ribonuclease III [Silanimonas sp.]MBS3895620.1 ribonuclease III [Silanimonas sp.]MBS3924297.1 ribonuclease III [Xanthomonadaceae bacterium]
MPAGFGHGFADPALLTTALRHRSAGAPHNERLEFLGDAVLALLVAEALHARWPQADEGALTRARSRLVCEPHLAGIARGLGLGEQLAMGPGELRSGGRQRESILADALEAVVGAIYADGGLEACRRVVLPWFEAGLATMPDGKAEKDPKTRLQEWLQARQWPRPEYELVEARGPDHARHFRVRARAGEPLLDVEGEGASLRHAEQAAADALLVALEAQHPKRGRSPTGDPAR